jgi:sugar phosphate isomerase/epimerase
MTIKLGCADFTWPLLPHAHVLQHIRLLGFDGADLGLMVGRSHIRPEMIHEDVPMWAGIVSERLERSGLAVADVFFVPAMNLFDRAVNNPDPTQQDEATTTFADALEFARRIGSPGMTMNSGVRFEGETPESSIRNSAEGLKRRLDAADRFGIQIRIEGGIGTNTDTPDKLLRLVELTPGLKLTVDYCHFVYQGLPESRIEPLLEFAGHFQCRGAASGRMQTKFQDNTIDYRRVLDRLQTLGYDGFFSMEYVWIDIWGCNETENTMETIQFRDMARAVLAGTEYVAFQSPY